MAIKGKHSAPEQYYVDAEELKKEVQLCQQTKTCTEKMGKMLLDITEHCLNHMPEFKRYSDVTKVELRSYNVYRWLKAGLWTVNTEKTAKNVFFYFFVGTKQNFINCLKSLQRKAEKDQIVKRHYVNEILQKCQDLPDDTKDFYRELVGETNKYICERNF